MGCLFDPGACIAAGWTNLWVGFVGAVPWWAWIAIALIAIGIVWKFAGWPGLIALAFGVGYFARDLHAAFKIVRKEPIENVDGPDAEPAPKRPEKPRRKTLQDLFREGLR
jgi:hypothetical protein